MSEEKQKSVSIRYLFELAQSHKGRLYAASVFGILSGIAMFVPFYCVYRVISLALNVEAGNMMKRGAIAAGCIVLRFLFHGLSSICSHLCAYDVLYVARKKICQHLGHINLGFFDNVGSGEIKKVLMEDVERLEHFLAHQIPDITTAVVVPIIVLGFLMTVNVPMALFLLVPVVISLFVQSMMIVIYMPMMKEYNKAQGTMNAAVVQFIEAMSVLKAFNLNANNYSAYAESSKTFNTLWKKGAHTAAPMSAVCIVLVESGIVFSVPFGGWLLTRGSMQSPQYVFFIIMSIVFLASYSNLMSFAQIFSQISAGLERIKEVMDIPEQPTLQEAESAVEANRGIVYQDVSFAYQDKNVLEHIDLTNPEGSFTAFVGHSGAGKSTAAQLIPRFWDVSSGKILLNGRDLRSYSSQELMQNLSFVFQETFLMEASLYDNIAMGCTNCTEQEVYEAAQAAQIHDFISELPEGYKTIYGSMGVKLSGGERQRICIARAILKNAPILILDEATSFSDVENEHKIQLALSNLIKNKTVIMIAHRLHTIKNADQICVFEQGKIVERGTHKHLMEQEGVYADMWKEYREVCTK